MEREKIEQFYIRWQSVLKQLIEGYIYDETGNLLPTRSIFLKFKKIIGKFLSNKISEIEKIILMPGLRGVGKSTILAQIFSLEKFLKIDEDKEIFENIGKLDERLYLDVSLLHAEQISLNDFFKFYEDVKGFRFERPKKKILILLDEIHFDEKWDLFLKNLFDRTKGHKDVLVIATGSSALEINMIADLSRRVEVLPVLPLNFSEYLILKGKYFPAELSEKIRQIIFSSQDANQVFRELQKVEKEVSRYFISNVPPGAINDFFEVGGFPSALMVQNKQKAMEKIKSVIDGIIVKDILKLKRFETHTIAKINDLLYLLAQSDIVSYQKLQLTLKIQRPETLENLIEVLIVSGLLVKVNAYGQTYGSVRKTPKFLFVTPSLRSAILNNIYLPGTEGKKLEDYFILIFQDIKRNGKFDFSRIFYDSAEGGADFILNVKENIVVELGFNKEETKQVQKTAKKVKKMRYGLIFGSRNLELVENSIVKIPLKFLLLM
jgi:predicted AAA+ superfamily ATPase